MCFLYNLNVVRITKSNLANKKTIKISVDTELHNNHKLSSDYTSLCKL